MIDFLEIFIIMIKYVGIMIFDLPTIIPDNT